MKLTGTVDQLERSGASSGQFETGFIDAETVAGERIALNRFVIANRVAMWQTDIVAGQLQRPGPFHRLYALTFAS